MTESEAKKLYELKFICTNCAGTSLIEYALVPSYGHVSKVEVYSPDDEDPSLDFSTTKHDYSAGDIQAFCCGQCGQDLIQPDGEGGGAVVADWATLVQYLLTLPVNQAAFKPKGMIEVEMYVMWPDGTWDAGHMIEVEPPQPGETSGELHLRCGLAMADRLRQAERPFVQLGIMDILYNEED